MCTVHVYGWVMYISSGIDNEAVVPPKMKNVSLSGCSLSAVRAHTLSLYTLILYNYMVVLSYFYTSIYGYMYKSRVWHWQMSPLRLVTT